MLLQLKWWIKATTIITNSWPRSVRKHSIFCKANEKKENHRPQQTAHRRKWNHKHPTLISTNLWVSTFFSKARNVQLRHCTRQQHKKKGHSYTRSWNDAIRAYGWRRVKAPFIRGLRPKTDGYFFGRWVHRCEDVRFFSLSSASSVFRITITSAHWKQKNDGYCGVSINFCTWHKRLASFALRPTCSP